ncbi:hypothetical protein A8990_11073 [Paenibacillus taihuensis]|uniref:Mor transcription activator family protein n=2 Tax=Paenibacillus taihuensis TaxID=1156355 RepID=A0A3D9S1Y4_9BACL|nr:CD3324 family protein [Paenibacillus taihuensis]REE86464.1 hypothetical protein A8990_11073 [Paenibacillus taihuensis]
MKKYRNAYVIFPSELLKEIQKYVSGGMVYIPAPEGTRKQWGENSGGKRMLSLRNEEIRCHFASGMTIDELCSQYCLSSDSIKKIVYNRSKPAKAASD